MVWTLKKNASANEPDLALALALGGDDPAEVLVDALPIHHVHTVGEIALAEGFPQDRGLVQCQPAPGIDRQIQIGIAPCAAGRARAEHPNSRLRRQMLCQNIPYQ